MFPPDTFYVHFECNYNTYLSCSYQKDFMHISNVISTCSQHSPSKHILSTSLQSEELGVLLQFVLKIIIDEIDKEANTLTDSKSPFQGASNWSWDSPVYHLLNS